MSPTLRARLQSGFLLGGAAIALFVFAQPALGLAVIAALGAIGLWEFFTLLDAARIPNFKVWGVLLGTGMMVGNGLILWLRPAQSGAMDALLLYAAALIVFLRQFEDKNNVRPLETMAGTLMGILYVAFMLSFFFRLVMLDGAMSGRWLLFFTVVVVKSTDIGAYFIGCAFGRHKLIPRISPGKSWEGCAGGIATGLLVSLVFYWITGGRIGPAVFSIGKLILLALLLSVAGILGDLIESLVKRAAGVKDSSALIAGMGGLLDVLDSLLLSVPVTYLFARLALGM